MHKIDLLLRSSVKRIRVAVCVYGVRPNQTACMGRWGFLELHGGTYPKRGGLIGEAELAGPLLWRKVLRHTPARFSRTMKGSWLPSMHSAANLVAKRPRSSQRIHTAMQGASCPVVRPAASIFTS